MVHVEVTYKQKCICIYRLIADEGETLDTLILLAIDKLKDCYTQEVIIETNDYEYMIIKRELI